jgi:hypothetical protein
MRRWVLRKVLGVADVRMAIRLLQHLVFVMLVGYAATSHAAGDRIRFTQSPVGAISATLDGWADPCNGSVIFPLGTPFVAPMGSEFDVLSPFAIADPPGCPLLPQPYQIGALLGTLADGNYTVVWTAGPLVVRADLSVVGGILAVPAAPVPTLGAPAILALMVLLATVVLATGCAKEATSAAPRSRSISRPSSTRSRTPTTR